MGYCTLFFASATWHHLAYCGSNFPSNAARFKQSMSQSLYFTSKFLGTNSIIFKSGFLSAGSVILVYNLHALESWIVWWCFFSFLSLLPWLWFLESSSWPVSWAPLLSLCLSKFEAVLKEMENNTYNKNFGSFLSKLQQITMMEVHW